MGKQKQLKSKHILLGGAGFGVIGLMLGMLACPMVRRAQAEGATATEEKTVMTKAIVRPALSIALDSVVTMDLTPRAGGAYSSAVASLTVSTNSRNGFAVLMNGVNGTDLRSSADETSDKIVTLTEPKIASDFPSNSWGYYIGEQDPEETSEFSGIPAVSTEIKSTETSTDKQSYKIAFGTKIDSSLEPGTYTNSVLVSVVVNPVELAGLQDLHYMQEMTPEICEMTGEETTKQLVDSRDGNTYWVAKLKDGHCWMTQNLALDLSTDQTFTSDDTDLPERRTYVPEFDTNAVAFVNTESSFNQYSWNLGKVTLATPLKNVSCDGYKVDSLVDIPPEKSFASFCSKAGFVDVPDSEWMPDYTATDGKITIDAEAKTYDPHYLVGNFYQYNAVTAGTSSNVGTAGGEVAGSICPKGWGLPSGGAKGEFAQLGAAYKGAQIDLKTQPSYFMRAGMVDYYYDSVRTSGVRGYYWASTTYRPSTDDPSADVLFLDGSSVKYDSATSHREGISVRCIAK